MLGVFISSTGTGAGKSFVARGVARALSSRGVRVAALKPLETGCEPDPLDAIALARACAHPKVAEAAGFYRVRPAVSPFAATLMGEARPDVEKLVESIRQAARGFERVIVEGAGGLLVPLDEEHDMSDLARALALPVVLVAPNRLGVLSHVLALTEVCRTRAIDVAAVVLSEPDAARDASSDTNAAILRTRLSVPILSFAHCPDDDDTLAAAAAASGLIEVSGLLR